MKDFYEENKEIPHTERGLVYDKNENYNTDIEICNQIEPNHQENRAKMAKFEMEI